MSTGAYEPQSLYPVDGVFKYEGRDIPWRKNPFQGGVIVMLYGNDGIHIPGNPSDDDMAKACAIYEQGYNTGLEMGRARLKNEIQRLFGIPMGHYHLG